MRAVLGERGDDPALAARTAEELRAEWSPSSSSLSPHEGGVSPRLKTVMQVHSLKKGVEGVDGDRLLEALT